MYIAVAAYDKEGRCAAVEVTTNAASSIEGMQAYSSLGYNTLRFITTEGAFRAFSGGENLHVEVYEDAGRIRHRIT